MKYDAKRLEHIANAFLKATGSDEYEAQIVARHLIGANLRGHDSHGIGMLAMYAGYLKEQKLRPNTAATILKDSGSILQFQGNRGYGQRIGYEATEQAIARAKENGLCMYTIANSCHLGRIGTYAEQATTQGMVSIHFVNVTQYGPLVAPYCGSSAIFGTNPVCIGMPAANKQPAFILDFATSIVAMGKTRVAHLAGKTFDEDVALDVQGHSTNDPSVMWQTPRGALIAFGKHKGSGLTLACELLAGILSQGATIQPEHDRDGSIVNNLTAFMINPEALCNLEWMRSEMDAMYDYVKSSPAPDPKEHPVLIAGDPERSRSQDRLAHGVEISEGEMAAILNVCRKAGVAEKELQ